MGIASTSWASTIISLQQWPLSLRPSYPASDCARAAAGALIHAMWLAGWPAGWVAIHPSTPQTMPINEDGPGVRTTPCATRLLFVRTLDAHACTVCSHVQPETPGRPSDSAPPCASALLAAFKRARESRYGPPLAGPPLPRCTCAAAPLSRARKVPGPRPSSPCWAGWTIVARSGSCLFPSCKSHGGKRQPGRVAVLRRECRTRRQDALHTDLGSQARQVDGNRLPRAAR